MTTADNLTKIFDKLPQALIPEQAAGVSATIQLTLTGDGGGSWLLHIADGQLTIETGQAAEPDLTLKMAAEDYVAMTMGEVDPAELFMTGNLEVQGDMMLALQFKDMFDRSRVEDA